ncbi:hypothetical protein K504DRAFT_508118 [Pleomassaria siparia CBS 279.74]|uniref:Uncharacterized protein n=1 Tax=Pleomassaria siparia CBS 279.74 TaxID=1314801 RepID=A0A6G1JSK6_9PLEO|nr:hypothetical protein K504DRAFT_508118 [Pleomassaria siparia CBS 279.74]
MSSSDDSDFILLDKQNITDYNDAGHLPVDTQALDSIQNWLASIKYLSENSEYRKHVSNYLEDTWLFLYARLVTDELVEAVQGRVIMPADIHPIVEGIPQSLGL